MTIGRTATMHGAKIGKQMGVNTWAAFAGTDDNALVDGDFVMTQDELQPKHRDSGKRTEIRLDTQSR